jgi:uncharacterized protein YndB with AHSA1/START domain
MADTFLYVTYIRTTPEKLWQALTTPEFNRVYWGGMWQDSDFQPGSSWALKFSDGRVADAGQVLESDPPRRLVLKWGHELRPELKAEGYSQASFDLEPVAGAVKLTVIHQIDQEGSKQIQAVSGGWPKILASLKSLLETGEALDTAVIRPEQVRPDAA